MRKNRKKGSLFVMWSLFHRKKISETVKESMPEKENDVFTSFLAIPSVDLEVKDSVYPPPDAPVSAMSTDAVLQSQSKLIRELMWAVSMDLADKDRYLLPVIKNVAAFVHLLPSSQSHHHNGRGGLFRHSLETAFYAVNIAKNRLMDVNANPADTYHNQSRWFLAIAIAGLLHDVGKCLTDMTVSSPQAPSSWLPTVETLSDWIKRYELKEYYCTWNLNRIHRQHECATAVLYSLLVPQETRQYLEESHSTKLKNELYEALAGVVREGGEIQAAVARADGISTKKDIARQLRDGFHPGVNAPIVVFLEKIMQELVEKGTWKVNQVNSPLWATTHGLFLVWHRAVKGIEERIRSENFPSLPRDPNIWQDRLRESSLVESRFLEDEYALKIQRTDWRILPYPELKHDCEQHRQRNKDGSDETPFTLNFLSALKLTDNCLVFSNIGQPVPAPVFIEGEPLSEDETKLWMATSNLPMTPFVSPETMNRVMTPAYSDDEVNAIVQASLFVPDDLSDFVIPELANFRFEASPYPDVPLNGLLKSVTEHQNKEQQPTTIGPKISVEELLSPSQKAQKRPPDVNSHNKASVHAQILKTAEGLESDKTTPLYTHTHKHTDKHTHTEVDGQKELNQTPENKLVTPNSTVIKKSIDEKKAYLNDLLVRIKTQLQAGQGELMEALLHRDDRIYASTAPIERELKANDIAFESFIDKLHEYQTAPVVSLTDNRDYVYIERNPS